MTCRPSEWRAIGAKARAEGMDVSAFILSRVLDGEAPDGPPHPEAGYPMALTGAEQRRLFDHVEQLVTNRHRFLGERFLWDTGTTLRQAVRFLVLASCADGPQETGTGEEGRSGDAPDNRPKPAAMDREEGDGADSGSPPDTGTAATPGPAPLPDPFPSRADLFDGLDAGPPSGDGSPPRDLLDDVADELNRDGGP
ncbi:MAG: hypothetical protein F4145_11090 [Boseongicola sp. SB0675_bin_26]|nr:hypothetical protein [Boseongicola sp. SB0675_bin_26]